MRQADVTTVAQLWAAYGQRRDRASRDGLILHYSPLVTQVAARLGRGLPQSVERSDLVSYGIFGLIDAIEKFEVDRGFKFESYAIARIKGAIFDELRTIDWVPRAERARTRRLEAAFAKLEGRLARTPTDAELAGELGLSVAELQRTLSRISFGLIALDEMQSGDDGSDVTTLGHTLADLGAGPGAAYEIVEMRSLLADAVSGIPDREKLVVTLYYYEGLTLAEIGEVLGVSESRVSQIHARAVLQLRSAVAAPNPKR